MKGPSNFYEISFELISSICNFIDQKSGYEYNKINTTYYLSIFLGLNVLLFHVKIRDFMFRSILIKKLFDFKG